MKYTHQELVWLKNLVDKAVIEASENMAQCGDHPLGRLAELHRDNMQDLSDKIQRDMENQQRLGRMERKER